LRFASPDLSFGAGAVTVSSSTQVSGSMRRVVRTATPNAFPSLLPGATVIGRPEEQPCTISGSVATRSTLAATFTCTTGSGGVEVRSYDFAYVSSVHAGPASLTSLAGNYTLSFRPASNMLNVNSNGEVFAMYDNAWQCTVNGRLSATDARFGLYRAEWTFSACANPASQRFEGATFSGFVHRTRVVATDGSATDGALYVLLTAPVQGQLSLISVVYDPT
jgi:hypothetical protein